MDAFLLYQTIFQSQCKYIDREEIERESSFKGECHHFGNIIKMCFFLLSFFSKAANQPSEHSGMHLFSPRAVSTSLTAQRKARGSAGGLRQRWAPEHQVVRAKIWKTKHYVSDLLDVRVMQLFQGLASDQIGSLDSLVWLPFEASHWNWNSLTCLTRITVSDFAQWRLSDHVIRCRGSIPVLQEFCINDAPSKPVHSHGFGKAKSATCGVNDCWCRFKAFARVGFQFLRRQSVQTDPPCLAATGTIRFRTLRPRDRKLKCKKAGLTVGVIISKHFGGHFFSISGCKRRWIVISCDAHASWRHVHIIQGFLGDESRTWLDVMHCQSSFRATQADFSKRLCQANR